MTQPTAWTIVGAGAIGGTFGHALSAAGHPVTVVDADAAHVEAVARGGLRVRRDAVGRFDGPVDSAGVVAAYTPDGAPGTLRGLRRVILATKSQHTADAAAWIAPRLADDGFVLSAQNGLNEPAIAEFTGAHRVIGAFVNIFADVVEPGLIRDGGAGAVVLGLGPGVPPDGRLLEAAEDLRAYGPVVTTANLLGYRWSKRAFAAILGVTSLVDAPIAEVVDRYRDVAGAAASEVTAVAVAEGVALEPFDAYEPYAFCAAASDRVRQRALDRLVAWLWAHPKDRSGVFRDIAVRRRPTESPSRPDGFLAATARHCLPDVTGRAVRRQLAEIGAGSRRFGWRNLEELRALL